MKLLITGVAGFIGSHLVSYMLQLRPNLEIVGLDNYSIGSNPRNLLPFLFNPRFTMVRGDICNEDLVRALLSGESKHGKIDGVINLAAESHVDRSIEHPAGFIQTNVIGTATLLHQCYLNNIGRFHQVSTDEVYGASTHNQEKGYNEFDLLDPSSPYSASKASADNLCRAWFKTYELPVVITRCTNNFGPNQHPEKLIPRTVFRLLSNEKATVHGDGSHKRDWLFVKDHCAAIDMVFFHGTSGEVYNVAAENERTNLDIITRIAYILGKNPDRVIQFVKDRPGQDERYFIDCSKIQHLGWKVAENSFDADLNSTVAWCKWAYKEDYFIHEER